MSQLFDSIENGNLEKVKTLIDNGANVNSINNGYSALLFASFNGKTDIALYLMDKGINVNFQDEKGNTILHYAAEYNQLDIAVKALTKGADFSITNSYGNEPLWTAVFNDKGKNDRIEIIKLLIENGANINHKNLADKSPKDIILIGNYMNLHSFIGE